MNPIKRFLFSAAILMATCLTMSAQLILTPFTKALLTNLNATAFRTAIGASDSNSTVVPDNYALFGLGMIPRAYIPAGSFNPNWGAAPVITINGNNWVGAKGFPSLFDATYCWRDCSIYRHGNTLFAAVTADASGLNSRSVSFVNIYSSTNFFSTYSFVTAAYFTNAAQSYPNPDQTYAPEFFVSNGVPCLIASCFFDDGGISHVFRIIQATDTAGLTTWGTATNISMGGLTGAANDPFLWDDTVNSGNWYLWCTSSAAYLYKSSTGPYGSWTLVTNINFNGAISEGASMVRLPNGRYRLYLDQYFNGQMIYAESPALESGWTLTGTNQDEYYWGHFTPIVLTNLVDIVAAHQAASSASRQTWSPQSVNPTWSSTNDEAYWGFGPYSFISGATTNASVSYQNGVGTFLNPQKHPHLLGAGEDGYVTIGGNGLVTPSVGKSNLTTTFLGTNIFSHVSGDGSSITNVPGIGLYGVGSPQNSIPAVKGQTYFDQASGHFWVNTNSTTSSWLQLL